MKMEKQDNNESASLSVQLNPTNESKVNHIPVQKFDSLASQSVTDIFRGVNQVIQNIMWEDVSRIFQNVEAEIRNDPQLALLTAIKLLIATRGFSEKFKRAIMLKLMEIIRNSGAVDKLPVSALKVLDELVTNEGSNKGIWEALVKVLESSREKGGDINSSNEDLDFRHNFRKSVNTNIVESSSQLQLRSKI